MSKVNVKFQRNLQHEARINDKVLILDEPKDIGGDGKGPSPYETMLAALGACTSMTMLMYARKKGWEVDNIEIELTHARIHVEDCKTCETKTGKLDKITRDIKVRGNISEEQLIKLLEIAEKCPVHRTLTTEVIISDNIDLVP